jgi:periplasmic protein CpxP/Spy
MKQILLAVIACAIFILPLSAQPRQRGPNLEQRVQMLKDSLKITDKQAAQIKTIFEKSQEQMQKNRDANPDDRDAMRATMEKLNEKTDAEIAKVLTPAQMKKYKEMQEQRRKQMQERMRDRE